MPLLFESAAQQADPTRPGTHALVVGVGAYPYLIGGALENEGKQQFPLKQLTSSPVSARAVADWLLATGPYQGLANAGLKNGSAPLASVELLVSGGAQEPTRDNLRGALNGWLDRLDRNEENIAFLYLCGHGLKAHDLVFLASDFGHVDVRNAFDFAFSLDALRLGMRRCKARRQFMFFDCCRAYAVDVNAGNETGIRIFDNILDSSDRRSFVALYAALEGSLAFGPPNQPSYFTGALLEALMGSASEQGNACWEVTSRALSGALDVIMHFDERTSLTSQLVGLDMSGNALLHELTLPPRVKTRIVCQPDARMPEVTFELQRAAERIVHLGARGELRTDVSPGEWSMTMTHNDGALPPQNQVRLIMPPACQKTFAIG